MILVDPRDGNDADHKVSRQLVRDIRRLGVEADTQRIPYGDLNFEGNGPNGTCMVGFERKTLYDMLDCIDSKRLTAHQIPGMKKLYGIHRFIIFEALWRSDEQGLLMEGFNHGYSWRWAQVGWGREKRPIMYSKLFRFLISMQLAGTTLIQSNSLQDTARVAVEYFHYFQKPWKSHRSQRELKTPIMPSMDTQTSLVRQWAHAIQGVGLEFSGEAEKLFNSGLELAHSTEEEWDSIEGIGPATARDIVRQIEGRARGK